MSRNPENSSAIPLLPVKVSEEDIEKSPDLLKILNNLSEKISSSGTSKEKQEKIQSLIRNIKQLRHQNQENDVLLKSVKRVALPTIATPAIGTVPTVLQKANKIIALADAKRLSQSGQSIGNLLGIDQAWMIKSQPVLTNKEAKELQLAVEQDLQKKYGNVSIPTKKYTDFASEEERLEKKEILIRDLNKELDLFNDLVLSERGIYRDLMMLRHLNVDIANKQTESMQVLLRVTELKAKLCEAEIAQQLYMSNPQTVAALLKISEELNNLLAASTERLEKLQEDREVFKVLEKDPRFVRVVNEYRDILRIIDNKKAALLEL